MKLIKTALLIIMAMVSLVLVVGCGSNTASNLEGTYQTKLIDQKDGTKLFEVATIKKINNNSYEIIVYNFNDARDISGRDPNYAVPKWKGKVWLTETNRYTATLNKETLQTNSERSTYTIANNGEFQLKNQLSIDLDLKKVSDTVQELKDFSPVPVSELVK